MKPRQLENPQPPPDILTPFRLGVIIFAATLAAYFPALQGGFIWDDQPGHITRPELRSFAGLARIWFEPGATQQYYPLLHSAFWLEHRLWGDAPFGYHLINVLLHATSACLVGAILRRLAVPGAGLAALIFALHPVAVDSVAWISEQKNTLSTVLYLCAALAYLRFNDDRRPGRYALATTCFALALLTKTVTATLPAALLVILWWRQGRLGWRRDVAPLLPWFALGTAAGLYTAWFEHAQIGAQGADFALGPVERVLLAGRALWFYAAKVVWPAELIFIYPRWTIDAGEAWQWLFPLGAMALIAGLAWRRRQNAGLLAGALFFGGTLFPALGFVNVFPFLYSYVADHFQYVASLGLITLGAAGASRGLERLPRTGAIAVTIALLGTLGTFTWQHAGTYRDVFTLYRTTLAKNPACWMAHNNLGIALVDAGRADEALTHYHQALGLRRDYAEAENNLGYALSRLGRHAEALTHLERAIQLKPGYADAHNNLGAALMGVGRSTEGIAAFATAIGLNPRDAVAHFNHGLAIASSGRPAEAIAHFERALSLNPGYAEAELNWGVALTVTGRTSEALPHFERALQLNPALPHAHLSFGRALAGIGRYDDAIARFRAALELEPRSGEAHLQLALALHQTGRRDEAELHAQTARQLGAR
ncbi:tetratricopeptide repeat protein [Horticoccus sp. 23ND18S-11]|uniref:tetratricopeptide repeat protein n=1 Tax=Horticoccus sp. 23ND18S-11 TaxID=3391832 RepID=UPI0039C8EF53